MPLLTDRPPATLSMEITAPRMCRHASIFNSPARSSPRPVPSSCRRTAVFARIINVTFYDGHGELVKLDRLWQLYWSVDWQPPLKRPGLP